jgi:YfiR/HmsC-like
MALRLTRSKAILVIAATLSMPASSARAEDPAIPLQLQAELTAKLIEYAQVPSAQGLSVMRIGILVRNGSVESQHFGSELKAAFGRMGTIAGLPHEEAFITWTNAAAFAEEVRRRQLFAVYLTPGLRGEVGAIARALEGAPVISVAALDSYVPGGAILGFELVSGRPRMVLNLAQTRKQGVAFRAQVMKLMRIVD